MNSWTPIILAFLGQTALIIGCYIYVSRQAQSQNQHWERLFADHRKSDGETHALLFDLIRTVTANHAFTKGWIKAKEERE